MRASSLWARRSLILIFCHILCRRSRFLLLALSILDIWMGFAAVLHRELFLYWKLQRKVAGRVKMDFYTLKTHWWIRYGYLTWMKIEFKFHWLWTESCELMKKLPLAIVCYCKSIMWGHTEMCSEIKFITKTQDVVERVLSEISLASANMLEKQWPVLQFAIRADMTSTGRRKDEKRRASKRENIFSDATDNPRKSS